MTRESDKDTRADLFKLIQGNSALLGATWIRLTIGPSKRHEKVSKAEIIVSKVKIILLTTIRSYIFKDFFDIVHKMSLIQTLINERPLFFC